MHHRNHPSHTLAYSPSHDYSPWIDMESLMDWAEQEKMFFTEFWTNRKHTPRETLESFLTWAIDTKVQFGKNDDGKTHVRIPKEAVRF